MPGFWGSLIQSTLKATFVTFLIIFALPLIPNLPPALKFTSFTVTDPLPLEGPLALNTCLNNSKRLFEKEIKGPEGLAVLNGELYLTLHGGYVAKLVRNRLVPVVKFGKECDDWTREAECGRPLGLFAVPPSTLYVMDAYYGMFKYDIETDQKIRLVAPGQVIAGRAPKIFNSVTVAQDGTVYWSDSSSDVTLEDGLFSMFADGSGRLLKYDPRTGLNTVLIDGMYFANGVALSPDESYVAVAETGRGRLLRYWLKGAQANTWDVLIDGLPGLPDNLRAGRNGFLVPLVLPRDEHTPALAATIAPFPYIRKALARSLALIEAAFAWVNTMYPNEFCRRAVHFIGHFEMISVLVPKRVSILYVDTDGHILHSFYGLDGSVVSVCDAIVHEGAVYLGSPFSTYLGVASCPKLVAKLQDLFPRTTATPKPTTASPKPTATTPKPTAATTTTPKPTTTTPKPTTTTPKPTTATPKPATTTPKPTTKAKSTTQKPRSKSSVDKNDEL